MKGNYTKPHREVWQFGDGDLSGEWREDSGDIILMSIESEGYIAIVGIGELVIAMYREYIEMYIVHCTLYIVQCIFSIHCYYQLANTNNT